MSDRVRWLERGWFPLHFGFCPNEAAWRRELKRLGAPLEPYPTTDARCTYFSPPGGGNVCALVTVAERIDSRDPEGIVGLLVHEAAHIWQKLRDEIGEDRPSIEFEAYTLQHLAQSLIAAYRATRPGLARKKW